MKTITLTVSDDATITVDGKEYVPKELDAPTKPEWVLWTPEEGEMVSILGADGKIRDGKFGPFWQEGLDAGNVFPTHEHAEAAKRYREAQSVIDRYCYAKGIDTRWKQGVMQWGVYLGECSLTVSRFTETCYGSPFLVQSPAIAEQIITDCGDEIRTVLLRGWV